MVKVNGIYIDGWLQKNCNILKKNIKKDWDFWLLIDGMEGSGKSTFGTQIADYLDDTFCIERVCFTAEQFEEAVLKSNPYEAIIYDEAVTGTDSRDMTKMAMTLKRVAVQMRQKNLFIILILHSYFDMARYYAVHRTWFLLHTYVKPNMDTEMLERGSFAFFDYEKKKFMYCNDMARRNYNYYLTPNFYGSFTQNFPIDQKTYLEKKAKIEINGFNLGEHTFVTECFKRGFEVSEVQTHTTYSNKQLYNIKNSLLISNKPNLQYERDLIASE